jgi:N6-adenosine-specific RNA methylase IME4
VRRRPVGRDHRPDNGSSRFKPISEIVWLKRYPSGKARIGTGYRVRTMHEPILVCTVGAPQHKPFPSTFDGVAREHSRKPDEFYDLVLSHTPTKELKCRRDG